MDAPVTPDKRLRGTKADDVASSKTQRTSVDQKITENVHNIRIQLAQQGMFFEEEDSYEKQTEFKEHLNEMIFGDRASGMRALSVKKAKQFRKFHGDEDEETYFSYAVPVYIHVNGFPEAALSMSTDFVAQGLHHVKSGLFTPGVLPRRASEDWFEKIVGMTTPKPDYTFGLEQNRYPNEAEQQLSQEVQTLVSLCPNLRHPFFVIENKGANNSIEKAENQAIRSGAALVLAQRRLRYIAKKAVEARKQARESGKGKQKESSAESQSHNSGATRKWEDKEPKKGEEPVGVDRDTIAFSCSWTPQMAKIHVHWHERKDEKDGGDSVYHMDVLGAYLVGEDQYIRCFRNDVHNILEWGVSKERKDKIQAMMDQITGASD